MRIGLITGEYPPLQGGVGDFSYQLATALAALGHQIHVITTNRVTDCVSRIMDHVSRITPHAVLPHWGWRSYGTILNLVTQLQLDVLNVQYQAAAYDLHPAINLFPLCVHFPPLGRGLRRGKKRRPPVAVTFHDLKFPYIFPKAGPLRHWVVTLMARYADAAIVTNQADQLALQARRVDDVHRIPIGSNIAPTLPHGYDRDAWRAKLNLIPGDFLLGFFGFFNARKGVETLVRALAHLINQCPNVPTYHLLFIGGTTGSSDATNQAYAQHITSLITELSLTERVHYTGFVPATEVSAAFKAVDLCVLPYVDGISFHHGTLMAALAHGRPILSTEPPVDLPELVPGENVWLVPREDPAALADAIRTLAGQPERRRRLAQGAARLSTEFTWDRIARRTVDLFETLISDL
jgi:glycosyltransferase involved in cell wall biosynthesis